MKTAESGPIQSTGEDRFLRVAQSIILFFLPKFGSNLSVYLFEIFYMNEIQNFLSHSLESPPLDLGRNQHNDQLMFSSFSLCH